MASRMASVGWLQVSLRRSIMLVHHDILLPRKFTMRTLSIVLAAGAFAVTARAQAPQTTPPWAYALNPPAVPGARPAADDGKPKTVPGSSVSLMDPQIHDLFNPPDWYPDDHPKMPEVVSHGR